jgi:hypothetical protein
MRGNINKEMAKKMKRRDNLKSKLGDSQTAPKFDCEDRKKENGYDYFR